MLWLVQVEIRVHAFFPFWIMEPLMSFFMQVKVLFLILMDLCRRTAGLAHPLPVSQVGSSNIQIRLHYIDGNYTVLPEVVEASLGPHMQVLLL